MATHSIAERLQESASIIHSLAFIIQVSEVVGLDTASLRRHADRLIAEAVTAASVPVARASTSNLELIQSKGLLLQSVDAITGAQSTSLPMVAPFPSVTSPTTSL